MIIIKKKVAKISPLSLLLPLLRERKINCEIVAERTIGRSEPTAPNKRGANEKPLK
ncbi:MAG: hypothetical protein WC207_04745 [Sphaerochaetaceae bacterium]|nr:hypothetical protein [Sphaerochaetaceae bacterium]HHU88571.1 hypothetical protein [Spirochaetales bacterium]